MELKMQEKLRLINFFEFLLDQEVSKPLGEINTQAVDDCIKILLHLQGKHIELSPEFIDEQVRKIFHPEDKIAAPETAKTTKKHYRKNKVWLVAACIAILVALFSVLSIAYDWNVFDELKDRFGSVFSAPVQEELYFDGIAVINHGENTIYSDLEEALKEEKLNVLYPAYLPDSVAITDITFYTENSTNIMMYGFSSPDTYFKTFFNTSVTEATKKDATEICEINSITCYLCDIPELSSTQAEFEYKGNAYFISHSDKDTLIKMIENLKENDYEN